MRRPTTAEELKAAHDATGHRGEQIMVEAYGLFEAYPEWGPAYLQARSAADAGVVASVLNDYQRQLGGRPKYLVRGVCILIDGSAAAPASSIGEFEPHDWL